MPHPVTCSVIAGLALALVTGCGSDTKVPGTTKDRLVALGEGPVGIAAAPDGDLWVASAKANKVSRIPAGARKPDLSVDVAVPLRVTVAYGAVWVTSFSDARVFSERLPTG